MPSDAVVGKVHLAHVQKPPRECHTTGTDACQHYGQHLQPVSPSKLPCLQGSMPIIPAKVSRADPKHPHTSVPLNYQMSLPNLQRTFSMGCTEMICSTDDQIGASRHKQALDTGALGCWAKELTVCLCTDGIARARVRPHDDAFHLICHVIILFLA